MKDRINERTESLTRSERLLAEVLLRDYPVVGLQSITRLAEAAGVSTPTVIRLARKLGFDGFPEMQNALRDEASAQFKQPILKGDGWLEKRGDSAAFRGFAEAVFDNLRRTIERLAPETFDTISLILADPKKHVFMTGGRITRSNAEYFYNHLQIIRSGVTMLSQSSNVWPQYLLDMDDTSVLVILDIRRYERDLQRLAHLAKEQGATIILLTDQWGSPISQLADHTVNAMVEVPSSWDSTLAINLVAEALVAEVQTHHWEEARERIERLEDMFQSTKIFRKSP